jgi:methylthioribose-1-phosphate isomerase
LLSAGGVAAGGDVASLPAAGGAFVSAGAAGAAANSISAMMAMRAMRNNGETAVIVARQHSSARHPREARPTVIAGLDPAIHRLTKKALESYEDDGPAGQARG